MRIAMLVAIAGIGLAPSPAARPRLVVVITVDQLRPDYLERYRPQLIGGLGMLLRDGAVFTEAFQDHAVTETAPGHATILSGRGAPPPRLLPHPPPGPDPPAPPVRGPAAGPA